MSVVCRDVLRNTLIDHKFEMKIALVKERQRILPERERTYLIEKEKLKLSCFLLFTKQKYGYEIDT